MMGAPWIYFFSLWLVAFILAGWAVYAAQRFALHMAKRAAMPIKSLREPKVAVIAPIKGVDEDTADNIASLLKLEYPHYRVIFAVESENDPVVKLLEQTAAHDPRVEIVIAGESTSRGQKVHNQLAAVERTTEQDKVLAFVDADARPKPEWLRALIFPLDIGDENIAGATGYRFYVPTTSHPANKIVCVINAQVAALFGPYRRTFAWGGSMAIKRARFFELGIHEHWQNAISDDYVFSHCVRAMHKKVIQFAPKCLVASEANFTWSSLFEFAVRQYRITKVCAGFVWLTAVGGALAYLITLAYFFFFGVYYCITGKIFYEAIIHSTMFWTLYGLSIIRGYFLMKGGETFLPEHRAAIRSAWPWFTFLFPVVMLVNLLALLGAGLGRTVTWRGITYKMVSRTKTVVTRPTKRDVDQPFNTKTQSHEVARRA